MAASELEWSYNLAEARRVRFFESGKVVVGRFLATTGFGPPRLDPSAEDIESLVQWCESAVDDKFIIISESEDRQSFMQCLHEGGKTWRIEYREGGSRRHYGADTDRKTVQDLLCAYVGGHDWRNAIRWANVKA